MEHLLLDISLRRFPKPLKIRKWLFWGFGHFWVIITQLLVIITQEGNFMNFLRKWPFDFPWHSSILKGTMVSINCSSCISESHFISSNKCIGNIILFTCVIQLSIFFHVLLMEWVWIIIATRTLISWNSTFRLCLLIYFL